MQKEIDVEKMFPRAKKSVLLDLVNHARKNYPDIAKPVRQWQVERELGSIYEKTLPGSCKEKKILRFAEANKLMIVIPE
ncbi:MAG: hypothetical protein AB1298_01675 [Bacteroidota bacterium]